MKAQDIMTTDPACCTPDDSVRDAARLMLECDCGVIPVVDDRQSMRLTAIVTDRDIAVRGIAQGKGADARVREVMTASPSSCRPGADLKEVERLMEEQQVRRIPVVDDRGRCVGVIAQADLARAAEEGRVSEREVAHVVEKISEPARQSPPRPAGDRQPEVRQ